MNINEILIPEDSICIFVPEVTCRSNLKIITMKKIRKG